MMLRHRRQRRELAAEQEALLAHEEARRQWREDEHNLLEMIRYTRDFHGEAVRHDPRWHLQLRRGERALATFADAALVEHQRSPNAYVGGYSGFSFRLAKGIRYNIGGSRGAVLPGELRLTLAEWGTIWLTDQRIVFQGDQTAREWQFSKLLALQHHPTATMTLLPVSNRQKVSGFAYDEDHAAEIRFRLEHALANFHDSTDQFIAALESDLAELRSSEPVDPTAAPSSATELPMTADTTSIRRATPLEVAVEPGATETDARWWLVRTANPGFPACRDGEVIVVNFHVQFDVSNEDAAGILARDQAVKPTHARQLASFVNEIDVGDRLVTRHDKQWFAGTVTGGYRYAPGLIADHPHARSVLWDTQPLDARIVAQVQAMKPAPYSTVIPLGKLIG